MMSLKAFHLFFIALSILTCFGFAAWAVADYGQMHNRLHLLLGILSGLGGLLLIGYLRSAVERFKQTRVGV